MKVHPRPRPTAQRHESLRRAKFIQVFTVDQVETQQFGIPPSPLKFGWGYVQFCLFDDNFPIPPENPELGTPFSNNGFHFVI